MCRSIVIRLVVVRYLTSIDYRTGISPTSNTARAASLAMIFRMRFEFLPCRGRVSQSFVLALQLHTQRRYAL